MIQIEAQQMSVVLPDGSEAQGLRKVIPVGPKEQAKLIRLGTIGITGVQRFNSLVCADRIGNSVAYGSVGVSPTESGMAVDLGLAFEAKNFLTSGPYKRALRYNGPQMLTDLETIRGYSAELSTRKVEAEVAASALDDCRDMWRKIAIAGLLTPRLIEDEPEAVYDTAIAYRQVVGQRQAPIQAVLDELIGGQSANE